MESRRASSGAGSDPTRKPVGRWPSPANASRAGPGRLNVLKTPVYSGRRGAGRRALTSQAASRLPAGVFAPRGLRHAAPT
ncbi:Protein of unknown function [Gryllus bimaculatus]|nr:Protein of unknown function [Gryllus bimaculatus]